MSSQREPMSEKKKAAAEKRKATLMSKKAEEHKKRSEEHRRALVEEKRAKVQRDHEKEKQDLDEQQARLDEQRLLADKNVILRRKLHEKYTKAIIDADLDISIVSDMLETKDIGHVCVHLFHLTNQDKMIANLTQKLEAIDGISDVHIIPSHGKCPPAYAEYQSKQFLRVCFTLKID